MSDVLLRSPRMVLTAPPPLDALDQGVIEEARRRRRRRRIAVAAASFVAALAGLAAFLLAGDGSTPARGVPPVRPQEPLPRLAGPRLAGATRLRIVAEGNGGPPSILDVDRATVQTVHGLGVRAATSLWSPRVELTAAPGGVLAVVNRQACERCARSQTEFLIGVDGSVRRLARQPLAAGTVETAPARGSTAVWVLRWPHGGPCTVRLVPGGRSALRVPCGDLVGASAAGVAISTGHGETIVDPLSGRVRYRAAPHDLLVPLSRDLAFDVAFQQWDPATGGHHGTPGLVNLISGQRRPLAWPSYFGDVIHVVPEPHGPLVAVDFGSPAYPGPPQAEDIWMLDTTTGAFSHLPAYPAQVDIKFSSVAWTGDDRLVIVAQGGGRTVVGVWRPGADTLPLRVVPSRSSGYSSSVPLVG